MKRALFAGFVVLAFNGCLHRSLKCQLGFHPYASNGKYVCHDVIQDDIEDDDSKGDPNQWVTKQ